MDGIETPEVDEVEFEFDETEDGSYLATAAVFGAGTIVGVVAAKSYGKVKAAIQNQLAARKAAKIKEIGLVVETTATEAE